MRFSNKIISVSRGWTAIFSLVVFLVFGATVLPNQSAKAAVYSVGVGSPDLSFYYTPARLYQMAEAYGPNGRQSYIYARSTFDLAFPLIYGAFLLMSIAWMAGYLTQVNSRWRLLALSPLAAVSLDLLENTAASIVIGRYPTKSPIAAMLSPWFTLLKWIFVGGSFSLILILLCLVLRKRLVSKN